MEALLFTCWHHDQWIGVECYHTVKRYEIVHQCSEKIRFDKIDNKIICTVIGDD
jgi:hypothetical protein